MSIKPTETISKIERTQRKAHALNIRVRSAFDKIAESTEQHGYQLCEMVRVLEQIRPRESRQINRQEASQSTGGRRRLPEDPCMNVNSFRKLLLCTRCCCRSWRENGGPDLNRNATGRAARGTPTTRRSTTSSSSRSSTSRAASRGASTTAASTRSRSQAPAPATLSRSRTRGGASSKRSQTNKKNNLNQDASIKPCPGKMAFRPSQLCH